jgi:Activator of Hsp90 ATPase homolog 1-like protein
MTETIQPVRASVVVGVDQKRAFDVFAHEMTSWWPASHHIGQAPIHEIVIEPFVGGRWYTTHTDGSQTETGVVTAYDPPHGFTVTWQISNQWEFRDGFVTTVELRFTPTDDGRTLVELEHRDLEAYGDKAAQMKETFEGPDAWGGMLQTYAEVAERG